MDRPILIDNTGTFRLLLPDVLIGEIAECACGALRETNINGDHTETSGWYMPTRS